MRIILLSSLVLLGACMDGEPEPAEGDTTATGEAAYDDAETEPDGTAHSPERPSPQPDSAPMRMFVHVAGSGSLSGLEPACEIEGATGNFDGILRGEGV